MVKQVLLLILLLLSGTLVAQKYTLSGHVRDASSGEELIGANVFVEETKGGSVTNVYGFYSITLPEGTYNVRYSFLGKKEQSFTVELTEDIKKDVELVDKGVELKAVEVTAEQKDRNVTSAEISTVKMDVQQVKELPSFLGEVDILKTIQLLPGVQSGGDASTGFFVRGGSADQNLILLDEATVYNASHLFNFFSVFNSDAVKDLKLYKGGIPARYGGRLSSVLDIRMKDGNMKKFSSSGGIGLISSRLTVEGPIKKDKSSFLLSGRRTYADVFLKLFGNETASQSTLYFYDLNAKVNYKISDKDRVFLSGYFGRDVTGFSDAVGFDWGNTTGTLRWNHLFSDKLFSNFSFVYTNYLFKISGDIGPASFRWNSFINEGSLKGDFTYYLNNRNTLRWGLHSTYHNFDPGTITASVEGAFESKTELSANNGLEHGVYFSNEQQLGGRWLLVYGSRLSAFQNIGPDKVYEYDKSNELAYVPVDTTTVPKNEIYKTYYGFEPRLSARFTINSTSSIKASYNRMFQYVQQVQSAQSVAPYDIWFIANNNIPPQIADQVAMGYFRNLFANQLETSVEVYYKNILNQTDIVDNADVLGNELFDGQLRSGRGWSYGVEFLAKKNSGRFTGWLAYTWSKTQRQIDEINEGRKYYAPYDRRHSFSLTGNYKITDVIGVSTNFTYNNGQAYTLPIGRYVYQGNTIPLYDERNSNRLPDYHRLDLAVNFDFKDIKKDGSKRKLDNSLIVSVYNVYARKNPISISFTEDENGNPKTDMFYIPGPIPGITWNFKF